MRIHHILQRHSSSYHEFGEQRVQNPSCIYKVQYPSIEAFNSLLLGELMGRVIARPPRVQIGILEEERSTERIKYYGMDVRFLKRRLTVGISGCLLMLKWLRLD